MNYYNEIKNELINNEINRKVKNYSINKSDLNTYYNVGKLLFEAGKHYGEGIIKEYSKRLTNELGKGYSTTRLKYIRRFYEVVKKSPILMDIFLWYKSEDGALIYSVFDTNEQAFNHALRNDFGMDEICYSGSFGHTGPVLFWRGSAGGIQVRICPEPYARSRNR